MPSQPTDLREQNIDDCFRCELESRVTAVERLTRDMAAWAKDRGVPGSIMHSVALLMDELFTNIVMHGYHYDPSGKILVEACIGPDAITVTLTDHARPFNPAAIKEPDTSLPLDERQIGGLGLLFVRRTADTFTYRLLRRGARSSNQVTFSKRLTPPPAKTKP